MPKPRQPRPLRNLAIDRWLASLPKDAKLRETRKAAKMLKRIKAHKSAS